MTDSIETSEHEAVTPAPGSIKTHKQLTAEQIIGMIHPDLPPATAHFLLNEAKSLLIELVKLQAQDTHPKASE